MKVALVLCPCWGHASPPLSLACLRANLKKEGHKVFPIDLSLGLYSKSKLAYQLSYLIQDLSYLARLKGPGLSWFVPKEYLRAQVATILSTNADVFCFSVYRTNVLASLFVASRIKKAKPSAKIIFGGPACYFSFVKAHLVGSRLADYVECGESDLLISGLLRKIADDNYEIRKSIVNDLDEETLPDFSGFDLSGYKKSLPYSTTRGCYCSCEFCFDKVFWRKYRHKSPQKILKDLKRLEQNYSVNHFSFADSNMMGNMDNIKKFCELVTKNKFSIRWGGQIACQNLDRMLLKQMRDAGCAWLSFGVESGSQRVRSFMKKAGNLDALGKVIRHASDEGISVYVTLMVDYPTETWLEFYETLKFVFRNRRQITKVHCSPTSIYEGTRLYANAERLGIRNKDSFFWSYKRNNFFSRYLKFVALSFANAILINKFR